MGIEICNAKADDVSDLVRMRVSLQEHIMAENPRLYALSERGFSSLEAKYLEYIRDVDSHVVVGRVDKTSAIVAMAVARIITCNELQPSRYGRIDDVWVDSDFRCQGVCRSMMMRLLDFFDDINIANLRLDYTVVSRDSEAIWRRFGFEPVLTIANADLEEVRRLIHEEAL